MCQFNFSRSNYLVMCSTISLNPHQVDLMRTKFNITDCCFVMQVADYCCKRIHLALVEELKLFKDDMVDGSAKDTRQVQWEKVFTSCFLKVDDEVGGKVNSDPGEDNIDTTSCASEPIAPETVGSTAVVAVICSSHIVVSNCGDSRAVLYRGKEAMALSIDHKVNHTFSITFCLLLLPFLFLFFHIHACLILAGKNVVDPLPSHSFTLYSFTSQAEKMSMLELKHLVARSFSGMDIVFLASLQCQDLLVGLLKLSACIY